VPRVPDCVTMAENGVKVVRFKPQSLFTPRKYSWYAFLLEVESIPGTQCDRKDYVNEKLK